MNETIEAPKIICEEEYVCTGPYHCHEVKEECSPNQAKS